MPTLCISRGHVCARKRMRKTHNAATFFPKTPDIFHVFLSGAVGFRRGKRTFHGRKTYGSPTGNLENLKATKDYLTGISTIRNA